MRKLLLLLSLVLSVLMFSSVVVGDIVIVDNSGPANHATIQAAINDIATVDGDVIIVEAGRYVENIDLLGKAITLRSADPSDGDVVLSTIIDGGASGSVITCNTGEGADTVIDGFLITNGQGAHGGGMYNEETSPTVSNCVFSGNRTAAGGTGITDIPPGDGGDGGDGGGMYNLNASPTVSNCTFIGNSTGNGGRGGDGYNGLAVSTGGTGGKAGFGGGMYNENSSAEIINCRFTGNFAGNGGSGGNYEGNGAAGGSGGGIYNVNSSPLIDSCVFTDNSAGNGGVGKANGPGTGGNGGAGGSGGGICNDSSMPEVIDCVFSGNTTGDGAEGGDGNMESSGGAGGAAGDGGGMYNIDSSPLISNGAFSGNSVGVGGSGGDGAGSGYDGADGAGGVGGGVYTSGTGSPEVSDSRFCINTPDQIFGEYTDDDGNVLNDDHCPPPRALVPLYAGDISGDGAVDLADFAIIADRMRAIVVLAENWLEGTD